MNENPLPPPLLLDIAAWTFNKIATYYKIKVHKLQKENGLKFAKNQDLGSNWMTPQISYTTLIKPLALLKPLSTVGCKSKMRQKAFYFWILLRLEMTEKSNWA